MKHFFFLSLLCERHASTLKCVLIKARIPVESTMSKRFYYAYCVSSPTHTHTHIVHAWLEAPAMNLQPSQLRYNFRWSSCTMLPISWNQYSVKLTIYSQTHNARPWLRTNRHNTHNQHPPTTSLFLPKLVLICIASQCNSHNNSYYIYIYIDVTPVLLLDAMHRNPKLNVPALYCFVQ